MGIDIKTIQTLMSPIECCKRAYYMSRKLYDSSVKFNKERGDKKLEVFERELMPNNDILSATVAKLNYSLASSLMKSIRDEANIRRMNISANFAKGGKEGKDDISFFTKSEESFKKMSHDFYKEMRKYNYLRKEAKRLRRLCRGIKNKLVKDVSKSIKTTQEQQLKKMQQEQQRRLKKEISNITKKGAINTKNVMQGNFNKNKNEIEGNFDKNRNMRRAA